MILQYWVVWIVFITNRVANANHVLGGIQMAQWINGIRQRLAKRAVDASAERNQRQIDLVGQTQLAVIVSLLGVWYHEAGMGEDIVRFHRHIPHHHREFVQAQAQQIRRWTDEHLNEVANKL